MSGNWMSDQQEQDQRNVNRERQQALLGAVSGTATGRAMAAEDFKEQGSRFGDPCFASAAQDKLSREMKQDAATGSLNHNWEILASPKLLPILLVLL